MTLERVDINHCPDRLQVFLHRQRYDFVLERLSSEDSVLDIGVGSGALAKELLPRCRSYAGVEYDREAYLQAREVTEGRADIVQGDARSLPFAANQFSFIICLEVLEHLGDYGAAVREIDRCITPDGKVVVSVPYRRFGGTSANEHHPYEPGERELVFLFRQLFGKVEVYYQYFEEPLSWIMARLLHIRRFVGLSGIYADLAAGLPRATSRLRINRQARGHKNGLLIVASGKKSVTANE